MILARALRRVALAFALMAAAAGILGAVYFDHLFPFDLDGRPGTLTRFHLSLLAREPDRCYAALDRAKISYRRIPPLEHSKGCGYADGVQLQKSGVSYGGGVSLRCPALLGLLLWERHVLAPAAREHLAREVVAVRHLGTYSCRPIFGREGRLSQHAFANAIDVAAVTVQGGEIVSVLRDWNDEGGKGGFLRALRDGACRIFSATLSPEFNAAHANHFHFDMGRWRICR